MRWAVGILVTLSLAIVSAAAQASPADAPELAHAGPYAIGFASETFAPPASGSRLGRRLAVDIWYPAAPDATAPKIVYAGALTGEDGHDVAFTDPGSAVRDAEPLGGSFPLVVLAHGYGGTPVAMSWLAENLASKGYVVVGPHFEDPPITDLAEFAIPLARRPLDIAYVADEAARRARAGLGPLRSADASRTVLIGYSMGGYGVLTDAGARLDPALATMTHGDVAPYVNGAPDAKALTVANLKAVVAISPASRFGPVQAWGDTGLAAVTAPTLFVVGDADRLVGYDPGVKTLFDEETAAPRYLLTFENAGHSIGMNAAPASMRGRLWDQDWFEDPVWRKDRVEAIQLHFITAFLDLYVKGEADKRAYLDVAQPLSNAGVWPARPGEAYDRYSPGTPPITLWKGFQREHAAGLELRFRAPAAP
jgi:predicted dienelactone hydrolase